MVVVILSLVNNLTVGVVNVGITYLLFVKSRLLMKKTKPHLCVKTVLLNGISLFENPVLSYYYGYKDKDYNYRDHKVTIERPNC